jgi:helicase
MYLPIKSSMDLARTTAESYLKGAGSHSDGMESAYALLAYDESEDSSNLAIRCLCKFGSIDDELKSDLDRSLFEECVIQSRNFGYFETYELLHRRKFNLKKVSGYIKDHYTCDDGSTVYTKYQYQLIKIFMEYRRIVVSAPTSFGKSRLLREMIIKAAFKKVLIIVPTNALIIETFSAFATDERFAEFAMLASHASVDIPENYIYVMTPEKADALIGEGGHVDLDFFSFDEVYKLADDIGRKSVFNSVVYRLAKTVEAFYLIGPYFSGFDQQFLRKMNASFVQFKTELVSKEEIILPRHETGKEITFSGATFKYLKSDRLTLRNIINAYSGESFLIYSGRTDSVEVLAKYITGIVKESGNVAFADYVGECIHPQWGLIDMLKHGVAFHHSAMPRFVQREVVDLFNRGIVKFLVCTTTLIEGVNTTAKNVVVFADKKGDSPLTGYDYKNLRGRAGRYMQHFEGRVFSFHDIKEADHDEIEFEYFSENIGDDDLLNVDAIDLEPRERERQADAVSLVMEEEVPLELLARSRYVAPFKQLALIKHLKQKSVPELSIMLDSMGMVDKVALESALELIGEYLFSATEKNDLSYPIWKISKFVTKYVYGRPKLREFIDFQDAAGIDAKIRGAFRWKTKYFEFIIPKYLMCFEICFNWVMTVKGSDKKLSYKTLLMTLKYGGTKAQDIVLKEVGVPDELVNKISARFSKVTSLEEMRLTIRANTARLDDLTLLEKNILSHSIGIGKID